MNTVAQLRKPEPSLLAGTVEIIDAQELGARLKVPKSWILEGTRSRTVDPIPCLRLGKYVRFRWGSRELSEWLERRQSGSK